MVIDWFWMQFKLLSIGQFSGLEMHSVHSVELFSTWTFVMIPFVCYWSLNSSNFKECLWQTMCAVCVFIPSPIKVGSGHTIFWSFLGPRFGLFPSLDFLYKMETQYGKLHQFIFSACRVRRSDLVSIQFCWFQII